VHNRESSKGFAYPWDFGLVRDYDDLLEARVGRSCPFEIWPDLWARLSRRREIQLTYEHPPHALGLNSPRPSMSSDEHSDETEIPADSIKQELADESEIEADSMQQPQAPGRSRSRSRSMSRGSLSLGI